MPDHLSLAVHVLGLTDNGVQVVTQASTAWPFWLGRHRGATWVDPPEVGKFQSVIVPMWAAEKHKQLNSAVEYERNLGIKYAEPRREYEMAEFTGIECAFIGQLAADAELKTYQGDKPMGAVRVGVGTGENTQWIGIVTFGDRAHQLVQGLQRGNRVYVEGRLKLETWTSKDGVQKSGLKVSAWKIEKLAQIGANKSAPANGKQTTTATPARPLSDQIPF
jgi:single-strand DNA-binding protein